MNMKQSCKALICAIEGELDGRHCTEEQAAAILDHALPSLTEALARVEAERDRFRAVLEGAEYGNIDEIPKFSLDQCQWLGRKVGDMTKSALADRNLLRDQCKAYVRTGNEVLAERDTAQTQLAEAVGVIQNIAQTLEGQEDCRSMRQAHSLRKFLARHAQAEQQEAGEMLPRVKHLLPMPAVKPPKPEAQGEQAGDSPVDGMEEFLADLARSRGKYPNNARMFDGLLGEVDELRRAYAGDGDVRAEAFDVAVCAFRIATEGDSGGNAALATQPAAGEPVAFDGKTVADRLDQMADAQPSGSSAQSDLYAAATVWRKHLAPPAAADGDEAVQKPSWKDEHEAFKSWARSRITPLKLDLDEVGLFYDEVAGVAHDAWHARAAMRAQGDGGEG